MTQLGTLETRLRDGTISLEELRDIISWDYQDIDHPLADIDDKFGLDDLPYNHTYWICACLEVFTGIMLNFFIISKHLEFLKQKKICMSFKKKKKELLVCTTFQLKLFWFKMKFFK